jgi:hypothetical protein
MKSYVHFLNENFMVGKNYDKFKKLITKYGFEYDDSDDEYRYYAKLEQGVIELFIDTFTKKDGGEDPDMWQWSLDFHPYIKVEKKLLGLIKKRIIAKNVDLAKGIFDFGYGMFAADDDKILSELENTIKDVIKKVEKLDPEEIYKEENIKGVNNNLPTWISGKDSGGFAPKDTLYKNPKDRTKKVFNK